VNMKMDRSKYHCNRINGLGLIEIMIALALGVIIMLGVTEIATQNSLIRYELERTGRQIESAAYALRVIENDINSSDFWGEVGDTPRWSPTMPSLPTLPASGLPPVCAGLNADMDIARGELWQTVGVPVQGQEATVGGNCITTVKSGTEFIAVRRASSCALGTLPSGTCDSEGTDFHVQINACFDPADGARLPADLYIEAGGSGLSALSGETRDCVSGVLAPRYRILSSVYFVNDGAGVDDDDQLRRARLEGSGAGSAYSQVTLVEGVELLRFEYGLDNDGDGQIDEIESAPIDAQWGDVVMVRIYLVVRNLEPSPGYTDDRAYPNIAGAAYVVPNDVKGHRRQLYTRTVGLRNVAGRREQQ
jgi:type IV pilus assembly protein PilW